MNRPRKLQKQILKETLQEQEPVTSAFVEKIRQDQNRKDVGEERRKALKELQQCYTKERVSNGFFESNWDSHVVG